jgi:hypothetical protein
MDSWLEQPINLNMIGEANASRTGEAVEPSEILPMYLSQKIESARLKLYSRFELSAGIDSRIQGLRIICAF